MSPARNLGWPEHIRAFVMHATKFQTVLVMGLPL